MNFRILGVVQELLDRARYGRDGITFGGKRDIYRTLGYERVLRPEKYRDRFERNAVAARIVEAKPIATWRGGFDLIEDEDESKTTPFEKEWDELNKRLKITSRMQQADILAGLAGYSVIVFGAPGKFEEPLESCSAKELMYLSVYAADDAPVAEFEIEETNPRYGHPVFYTLKRTASRTSTQTKSNQAGKRVHFSRVMHIADGVLDDPVNGTPRMKRCWNLLDDLEKVTGGGAEAFWRRADQGQQFDLDPDMELDEAAKLKLEEEVDKYVHGFSRIMRTRGMKVNSLGSDVASFKDPAEAILAQISAGTGIPQRILMGSEQAKLAAEQDKTKWDQDIEARRADFAGPQVVRPFLDRMIELGVLTEPKEYEVEWSQLKTADDGEKVEYATKLAQLNGTMGEEVVTVDEVREAIGKAPLAESTDDPNAPLDARSKRAASTYADIHRSADRFLPRTKKILKAAFNQGKAQLDSEKLHTALTEKDEDAVLSMLSEAITAVEDALRSPFEQVLTDVMRTSGKAAARKLKKSLRVNGLRAAAPEIKDFEFDVTNPEAVEWIKDHAGDLIKNVSKTTREEIKDLVERAFTEQFDVDDLAEQISEIIGDDTRAEVIARTETMNASNEGQQQLWEQAQEAGFLTGEEKKEWITTPDDRLCPICEPMDGVTVAMSEDFNVDGDQVDNPPAHPNCRCTIALTAM